jgi:hypothetical protein
MKALSRYPAQRYKSATEMRIALDAALLAPALQRRARRRIAAAALASATTLVAMFAFKSSHDPAVRARALSMFGAKTELAAPVSAAAAVPAATTTMVDPPVATLYEAPKPAAEPAALPAVPAASGESAESDSEDAEDTAPSAAPNPDQMPSSADPASPEGATFDSELARAEAFAKKGLTLQALGAFRTLGARHASDARVLRGWSQAAVKTKGWGEALRVAILWASTDPSPDAQLYLARIQRSAGQRYGAVATLTRLLEQHPDSHEAQDLLDRFAEKKLASR